MKHFAESLKRLGLQVERNVDIRVKKGEELRILFGVNSLVQGGAQRFTVNIAEELTRYNHQVEILCLYPEETDFFKIDKNIQVHRFVRPFQDRSRWVPRSFLRRPVRLVRRAQDLMAIRKIIIASKPDIIVAIEGYMGVLLGIVTPRGIPLVISERVHPKYHPVGGELERFQKWVYSRRNVSVHAQGWEIGHYLSSKYEKPVTVLPNIVRQPKKERIEKTKNRVLVLSRFSHQKGIDLVLRAWSQIPEYMQNSWTLEIYGDGDRSEMKSLLDELKINKSVSLNGPTLSTESLFEDSSIFVLPSRYEGFPNALAEAMSHGLACIATDCPSAIRELTLNGSLALLTQVSAEGIRDSLISLISDKSIRDELGDKAKKVSTIFSAAKVTKQWLDYFEQILLPAQHEIDCNACLTKLGSKDIVEWSHIDTLESTLEHVWNIKYNFYGNETKFIQRYECKKCGSSNFNMGPGDASFYSACYQSKLYSRTDDWDYVRAFEILESTQSLKILDVGSGVSRFISLIDCPCEKLTIVEIDRAIRDFQASSVFEAFPDIGSLTGKYDLIMMSHFLEHIVDPSAYLDEIKVHLKLNGRVFVTVPNAKYGSNFFSALDWPPHHVTRFTANGMHQLAHRSGFRVLQIHTKDYGTEDEFDFMFELALS